MGNAVDVVVIGSGAAGSTLAKELVRAGKSVLLLEKGKRLPSNDGLFTLARVANQVPVGDKLIAMNTITTGGSTAIYFAVAGEPDLALLSRYGIDLATDVQQAKQELPLTELPDDLLGRQAMALRDAAQALGLPWQKNVMMIDLKVSRAAYDHDAKWKAISQLDDAVARGAVLVEKVGKLRILLDKNRATGVEYRARGGMAQVAAKKVVVAAGALSTPHILRANGLPDVGKNGFFWDPGVVMYGFVPELAAEDCYLGAFTMNRDDGVVVGDANLNKKFFRMMMLGAGKFGRLRSYSECVGVGALFKSGAGGTLREDGSFHRTINAHERGKVAEAEAIAKDVMQEAGARDVVHFGLNPGNVTGTVRIQDYLDANLETRIGNLHVCDASVLPENFTSHPALTLVALAKYLARHLAANS